MTTQSSAGTPMKIVSNIQLAELQIADRIIAAVKNLTPFGSGNIEQADSDSNKAAYLRTQFVYDYTDQMMIYKPRVGWSKLWAHPRYTAIATEVSRAGNCDQLGAMAYYLCREQFPPNYTAAYVGGGGHTFALVGKTAEMPCTANGCIRISAWKKAIAVDPWPPLAQAVLYEDHFMFGADIRMRKSNVCLGHAINRDKYTSVRADMEKALIQYLWDIRHSSIPAQHTYYTNMYTAKIGARIAYVNLPPPPPPPLPPPPLPRLSQPQHQRLPPPPSRYPPPPPPPPSFPSLRHSDA